MVSTTRRAASEKSSRFLAGFAMRSDYGPAVTRQAQTDPLPPVEVVTDRVPALRAAIEGLMPAACHNTEQYANNRVECDHGRLKARLRPMRGLKRDHAARVIVRGHALMQNIRRGHYELGIDARTHRRIEHAFTELARTI